jgi:hypothetical protein
MIGRKPVIKITTWLCGRGPRDRVKLQNGRGAGVNAEYVPIPRVNMDADAEHSLPILVNTGFGRRVSRHAIPGPVRGSSRAPEDFQYHWISTAPLGGGQGSRYSLNAPRISGAGAGVPAGRPAPTL